MNELFSDRAAMLAKAARLVESGGLTVLDRDCEAGGHRLDLVAVTSGGTLIVVEVTVVAPDGVRAETADIAGERVLELLHGGEAWIYAHDGDYHDFRIESVVCTPDGPCELVPWHSTARMRQAGPK
jgi:Holliday junction resolvase-like predicted endonuclease